MDWSTIIVAALALIGTLAGSFFANSKTTAVLDIRIQSLEEKVNKHNQVVERMVIQEQSLKSVWRQIDEIKGEIKHEIIN
jgi:hypothetical protein